MKLSEAIALVGKVIPKRGYVQILANVRMSRANGIITLDAQNGETGIRCECTPYLGEDFVTLVPFTDLKPVAKMKAPVFTFDAERKFLIVDGGDEGKTEIPCLDPLDYPDFPKPLEGESLSFLAGQIPAAFTQVKHAVAKCVTRYALIGVLLESNAKGIRLVATDGHRLAKSEMGGPQGAQLRAIFPVLALECVPKDADVSVLAIQVEKAVLEKVARAEEALTAAEAAYKQETEKDESIRELDEVEAKCDGAQKALKAAREQAHTGNYIQAEIIGSDFRIFTRLVDGSFPDYMAIIPTERKVSVSVDRKAFQDAMKTTCAVVFGDGVPAVTLVGANCHITMKATSSSGQKAERVLSVQHMMANEEPYSIILNPYYLADMCAATKTERLVLDFKDRTTPIVARSLLGYPEWVEFIMPSTVDN
ncbi:MAG: DNA polymerase III subunit beta [Chloroflexota bacterium]